MLKIFRKIFRIWRHFKAIKSGQIDNFYQILTCLKLKSKKHVKERFSYMENVTKYFGAFD